MGNGLSVLMDWELYPSVIIGLALWTFAYAQASRRLQPQPRRKDGWLTPQAIAFHAGSILVFLALCSPLDRLADSFSFSAHMIQHMLLTYAAPPLWLIGISGEILARLSSFPKALRLAVTLASPLPAFVIFNGTMWFWHIPSLYDLAVQNEGIHILEHLTFIGSALIGWSPVILKSPVNRRGDLTRGIYLVLNAFPCTALGAVLTLSPAPLYAVYLLASKSVGINPLADQQLGGLLMWLPVDMALMAAALFLFGRWLSHQEQSAPQ